MFSKLQYISQGITAVEQEINISKALDAGADWIQLRWKQGNEIQLLALGIRIKELCQRYQATFIINDYPKIAKAVDASGVHLGLKDVTVQVARNLLGTEKIIGGTANNVYDVRQRIQENCDYIGLGPLRFTSTKEKLSPILGFAGFEQILKTIKADLISVPPIYALGGIKIEDIEPLQSIGVYGFAIASLITKEPILIPEIKSILQ